MDTGILAMLAVIALLFGWVAVELWRLNAAIQPLANSEAARFISGLGSSG